METIFPKENNIPKSWLTCYISQYFLLFNNFCVKVRSGNTIACNTEETNAIDGALSNIKQIAQEKYGETACDTILSTLYYFLTKYYDFNVVEDTLFMLGSMDSAYIPILDLVVELSDNEELQNSLKEKEETILILALFKAVSGSDIEKYTEGIEGDMKAFFWRNFSEYLDCFSAFAHNNEHFNYLSSKDRLIFLKLAVDAAIKKQKLLVDIFLTWTENVEESTESKCFQEVVRSLAAYVSEVSDGLSNTLFGELVFDTTVCTYGPEYEERTVTLSTKKLSPRAYILENDSYHLCLEEIIAVHFHCFKLENYSSFMEKLAIPEGNPDLWVGLNYTEITEYTKVLKQLSEDESDFRKHMNNPLFPLWPSVMEVLKRAENPE